MRSRFLSPGVHPHNEHICIGRSGDGAGNSGRRSGRTGYWRGLLKDEEEFSRQEAGSRVWDQKVMGVSEQGCRGGQVEFSEQVETKVIKVTEWMAGKWLCTLARRCQPKRSTKEVASGLRCFIPAVLGVLHPQLCGTRPCDLGSITL